MGDKEFKVTDLSSADWCFKKIKILQEKQKQIDEYVAFEKTKIENYYINEMNKIENDIEYFKSLLKIFVEEQQEQDPKFKLSTIEGTASFGKLQQKLRYDDEVMLDFCKKNNLDKFVNVTKTEKLNKKEFNSYLSIINDTVVTADGEILENVSIEEFKNFNVKVR